MNYKKIKEELIKKNGNKCSICGRKFDEFEHPTIDHIFPISLGGKDNIENLQLTCNICNIKKSDKLIYSEMFEKYIQLIIERNDKYEIVRNVKQISKQIDLLIKDNISGEYKICEIKTNTIFTLSRLNYIIDYMKDCRKKLEALYGNVKNVLIFPGKLSIKSELLLKSENIEIWDRDYLNLHFKTEIKELNIPYLNSILENDMYNIEKKLDEYDEKIVRLKVCETGKECWNRYQKLIGNILELLFFPQLEKPIEEKSDRTKTNRRDFIMPNYCQEGFWDFMRKNYCADFIVIDAKNSANGVKKQDILQLSNYLKRHRNRTIWINFC